MVIGWIALSAAFIALCSLALLYWRRFKEDFDPSHPVRALASLHAVRRRLQLALLRNEIKGDAARLRRQLDREILSVDEQDEES